MMMGFSSEAAFEDAVIDALQRNGWEATVLDRPTEQQLIDNWARILFDNNRHQDRLGDVPLTDGEMAQIMEQVINLRTPLKLNEFINGRTVSITRDAPEAVNFEKEVSLKIYDRMEIAGGQSRYQIARQPVYQTKNDILPGRRGDLMLLINGMPVFHLELKRSGVPVSQGFNQIEKYAHEGVYRGLFSLVQVFVAMTPEETWYFANPGPEGTFNRDFAFHWADFNNEPINEWSRVVQALLSIPMAHQLIGFYTVADRAEGRLMVMRSYQYFAASRIADRVTKKVWGDEQQRGGYIWHTTGSGKTVTSFKTAQLIADSQDADKVVFLLDRVELGTQSFDHYVSYGGEAIDVSQTENTWDLVASLKDPTKVLIVTSIHKMSRIHEDQVGSHDLEAIRKQRVLFVVDEAHRTTFGEMLQRIKHTLPDALFFGFTGTPIHDENQKAQHATTSAIFGDELHRYSIADGIRDQNVLGFDPELVETFSANKLRKQVALHEARAKNEAEVFADPEKTQVFTRFMDKQQVPMAGRSLPTGRRVRGIEDYVPRAQYETPEHREAVVADIMDHWMALSQNGKFHALLATSSIKEAIDYYRLFKERHPGLQVTALFDPNIDNTGNAQLDKEDGLVEILEDYNARYGQSFSMSTHDKFKEDVALRLAHKKPYNTPDFTRDKQIDLLIVVQQMLTGYDSKWLNTLYLDRLLEYEHVIQAFSRTNRLFGPEKPFGSIRYYRFPHTMRRNIDRAVALYSGDRPLGLFVDHLEEHLKRINECMEVIEKSFSGIDDYAKLPESEADQGQFAKAFSTLYHELQAARIQGFTWDQDTYPVPGSDEVIVMRLDEQVYQTLLARYKDLEQGGSGGGGQSVPFDINTHITHIDTARIDAEYLNDRFQKYLKARKDDWPAEQLAELLEEVHSSFALLSKEDQVFANLWLHDVKSGDAELDETKTVHDYITDYKQTHRDKQIAQLAAAVGVDPDQLRALLEASPTEGTIDEYGRFSALKESVDEQMAKNYLEGREGKPMSRFLVRVKIDGLLRDFVLNSELPEDLEASTEVGVHEEGG